MARMKDKDLAMLFENAVTQTLGQSRSSHLSAHSPCTRASSSFFLHLDHSGTDTTIRWHSDELTFIVTGDITAMWIRDSCNQLAIYQSLAPRDPKLANLIKGAVVRPSLFPPSLHTLTRTDVHLLFLSLEVYSDPPSPVPSRIPLLRRVPTAGHLRSRANDQRMVPGRLAPVQARQPDRVRVQVRARLDRRVPQAVEAVL